MAALLQAPTQFILLNSSSEDNNEMGVAEMGNDFVDEELLSLRNTLNSTTPSGVTPLTRHLQHVYRIVSSMLPSLIREGQRVVVVLATDGVPTNELGRTGQFVDSDFERALQRLQQLPVWLVVRLCTNDDAVVQYYQSLDDRLEWNLEVLDDFVDEAKEVYRYNPWLNYALPLHRCREWGFPNRLLDLLDEKSLTLEEMREFLQLLFGCETRFEDLPDPALDWKKFEVCVSRMVDREECPWNPIKKKATPWIDVGQLERCYGPHNFQWLPFLPIMGGLMMMLGALWHALVPVFHPMWHGLFHAPCPLWWNEGGLSWIVGGVLVLVFALSRRRPNAGLVLALLGVILSLALSSLWDKPWSFWQGIGWILGGISLLLGTIAYNDR
jgi:hypothetical protein